MAYFRLNSLAVTVNPKNAMNCFWPMPFRRRAHITLTNETNADVKLPLYRLVEEHYEEFERVYPDRFQARYGFWRSVIRTAVLSHSSLMIRNITSAIACARGFLRPTFSTPPPGCYSQAV